MATNKMIAVKPGFRRIELLVMAAARIRRDCRGMKWRLGGRFFRTAA
jgi:hypothetical protein